MTKKQKRKVVSILLNELHRLDGCALYSARHGRCSDLVAKLDAKRGELAGIISDLQTQWEIA